MTVQVIGFHVTDRCQLDCKHCLRDPDQKPTDLAVPFVADILRQARDVYRMHHAVFTGGEPLLHPEFEGLVDAAVDLGFTWHLVTNAKRFTRLVEALAARPIRKEKLTNPSISIDGATEAVHDGIRGAGSFRDCMTAATLCDVHGIPWVAQMVVNAKNQHEIEAMALLASHLGARRLSFVMMQPTGTIHDETLYLSPREWHAIADRVERIAGTIRLPVSMPEGWPKAERFHVCPPFASEQLHVDVRGRLNLCCQHSDLPSELPHPGDIAGDLHEVKLPEAHARFIDIVHGAERARLAEIASGAPADEWDPFPCNRCMKHFGKPHWSADRAGGPEAKRERWRGAWAPKSLPVVR